MEQTYDVIVVGAGPSGIAASISAAKNGAKTLLLEKETLIGGSASRCYISTLKGHAAGFMQESIDDLVTRAWGFSIFSAEKLMDRYYGLLKEYDVTLLCGHDVSEVQMRNQHITGIETTYCDYKSYFKAPIIIDASGGRLSHRIDHDVDDHPNHRYGMTALVGRVESVGGRCYSKEARQLLLDRINHAKDERKLLESFKLSIKPTVRGDMALIYVSIDMQEANYEACRQQLFIGMDYLREFGYGFENANVIVTSKHIDAFYPKGDCARYQLSEEDIQNGRVFSRWAASGCHSGMSLHKLSSNEEKPFCVPYASFIHTSVDNLLLCGRSIGVTDGAAPMMDGIPIHHVTGQAAGTVAAWCIEHHVLIQDVDIQALQKTLVQQGMDSPDGEGIAIPKHAEDHVPKETVKKDNRVIPIISKDQKEDTELEFDLNQIERMLLSALYGENQKADMPEVSEEETPPELPEDDIKKIKPSIPFEGDDFQDVIIEEKEEEEEENFFDTIQESLEKADIELKENIEKKDPQVTNGYVKQDEDLFIEVLPFKGLDELGIKEEDIPEEDMIMTLFIPDGEEVNEVSTTEPPKVEKDKTPLSQQPRTLEIPKDTIVDNPQDAYFQKGKNVFDDEQLLEKAKEDSWSEFKHLLDMLPDHLPEEDQDATD